MHPRASTLQQEKLTVRGLAAREYSLLTATIKKCSKEDLAEPKINKKKIFLIASVKKWKI